MCVCIYTTFKNILKQIRTYQTKSKYIKSNQICCTSYLLDFRKFALVQVFCFCHSFAKTWKKLKVNPIVNAMCSFGLKTTQSNFVSPNHHT